MAERGKEAVEGDLVEMGLFLLSSHEGTGKTEQGGRGKSHRCEY